MYREKGEASGASHTPKTTYSETSLNRSAIGPTLSGPFREVVHLGTYNIYTGDRLEPK